MKSLVTAQICTLNDESTEVCVTSSVKTSLAYVGLKNHLAIVRPFLSVAQ